MTREQWDYFCNFKTEFKNQIQKWQNTCPQLQSLQKEAAKLARTPDYSFEIPVVYNTNLDEITQDSEIKMIMIGDNPGKDEQLAKNQKYLVGQAGKIAEGFFKKNPELNIDFRKNVIILNKTPVHSAKTAQLKTMMKLGGPDVEQLILESQLWMAQKTAALHCALQNELWLVGYSELKEKGFFVPYRDTLQNYYKKNSPSDWNRLYVFQHFSMNRFPIDLKNFIAENEECFQKNANESSPLMNAIHKLGAIHRDEIFFRGN